MQSIDYASTIQRAMLNESLGAMKTTLSDVDIVWEPRDIVGGDFITSSPLTMAGLPRLLTALVTVCPVPF
ncbi:hypothetical protein [Neopusillimonas aromaticivorans]|uniref:hypothetical protein n=1 Tax=Neopusillimonas aromaticivorans TaxID=2979868 RepID=UPI003315F060